MLRDILGFSKAVIRHWLSFITGITVTAIMFIIHLLGRDIPQAFYWISLLGGLIVAFFMTWRDERKEKDRYIAQLASPQLALPSQAKPKNSEWQELLEQKNGLEEQLDAEYENIMKLNPTFKGEDSPEEPETRYYLEVEDKDAYWKIRRRIDHLLENIQMIKEKMGYHEPPF